MNKSPWYRWPEDKRSGIVPWFVILRRAFFWPFLLLGTSISFFAILGGFGIKEAKIFWRNNQ